MSVAVADQVSTPGVYEIAEDRYHADPVAERSLSASSARKLLPPSCPAKFRWQQLHGQPPKTEFDFGSAAHKVVLGAGPEIVVIEADSWRTKAAKEERDEARANGQIPLLEDEFETVAAMARAIKEHPVASVLFDPDRGGRPEQSLFWQDETSDIWRRCRLDWLPAAGNGRMIVADYKTCRGADLESISKAAMNYGYYMQGRWYLDAIEALEIDDNPAFVFVFQEKEPPHLVTVVELDHVALQIGARHNRRAIDIYAQCVETGEWPGYSNDIELVRLPEWFERIEGGDR